MENKHFVLAMLLFLCAIAPVGPANACTQKMKDRVVKVNEQVELLKKRYPCSRISVNSVRADCWSVSNFTPEDSQRFDWLLGEYDSLSVCNISKMAFNLADYRQSFGQFCQAAEIFSSIRQSASIRDLSNVTAEAVLQCRENIHRGVELEGGTSITADRAFDLMSGMYSRAVVSSRVESEVILAVWRNLFAQGAVGRTATDVARRISGDELAWRNWEIFLRSVRGHYPLRADRYFPQKGQVAVTARQYQSTLRIF